MRYLFILLIPNKCAQVHTFEEEGPCLCVGGDTLEQRQCVADPIGRMRREGRRRQERVYGDNFLHKRRHSAWRLRKQSGWS
jgi:hypothetical protein